jgi:hypothetical protein
VLAELVETDPFDGELLATGLVTAVSAERLKYKAANIAAASTAPIMMNGTLRFMQSPA